MNSAQSKIGRHKRQILVVLTVAAVGMSTLLTLLADTGHDQLWLLLAAQRMGHTLNPYSQQVFESNPPLAIWLSAIIVKLATLLHLPLTVAFKLCITVVALASATVSGKLLGRLHPELTANQLWLRGIAFVVIFGAVPVRDFGQRDYVLALLVLPYLFAAALDTHRRAPRLSWAIRASLTAFAALGIALKPHQAVIPVVIELVLMLRWTNRIQRRPQNPGTQSPLYSPPLRVVEPIVFVLAAASYLGAIRLFAPTYLTEIFPILRETYWAIGGLSLSRLFDASAALNILIVANLALNVILTRKMHESAAIPVINLAGISATVAFYLQGTGWYYQQLPAICLFLLATVFQLIDLTNLRNLSVPKWLAIPLAALTILAFILTIHFSDFHLTPRGLEQTQSTPDPTFFANLPPNAAVATITTSVDDTVPPAFRYHLTLAQRYPHLWMLPAILRNESGPGPSHAIAPDRLAELDRLQHQFMVEDLNRWHPVLILVARCQDPAVHCQTLEDRHDNLLAWFLRDPAFAAIFAQYHFDRSSGPYDAYRLN